MFAFWKKSKAASGAKFAISQILELFHSRERFSNNSIKPDIWREPYIIGFFHNIVRYWFNLQFGREASAEEFGEVFYKVIYESSRSAVAAGTALKTLQSSFANLELAGELAQEDYGVTLAHFISTTGSLKNAASAMSAIQPRLDAAWIARDFLNGAENGLIFVHLVVGTNVYDHDGRLREAHRLARLLGGTSKAVTSAHLQLTIMAKYKELSASA